MNRMLSISQHLSLRSDLVAVLHHHLKILTRVGRLAYNTSSRVFTLAFRYSSRNTILPVSMLSA
jgi:hypothetical protein